MKRTGILGVLLLSFIFVLSCQKEKRALSSESSSRGKMVTITASVTDEDALETKTSLNGNGEFLWSPSDEINIIYGSGNGSKFTSVNTEPAAITQFRGMIDVITGYDEDTPDIKFWGIYPYYGDNIVISEGETSHANVYIPYYQKSGENTWGEKQFLYMGQSDGLAMGFRNVCSGFKFYLERDDIREIHFSLNNGAPLSGRVNVEMNDGVPVITGFEDPLYGEMIYDEIILVPENGGTFKKSVEGNVIWYYMAIPPGTYGPRTFTFITDNEVGVRTFSSNQTATRNKFITWDWPGKALDRTDNNSSGVPYTTYSPISVPDNQITYNSSEIASIPDTEECCPDGYTYNPVVSHSFDILSRKGVITYQNPVTYVEDHFMVGNSSVTSVQLPDGVEVIAESAFESCTNLTGIHLGSGLKSIGAKAFSHCYNLKSITFPAGFPGSGLPAVGTRPVIPENPFLMCRSLESFKSQGNAMIGQSGIMTSEDGRCLISYDPDGSDSFTLYAFAPAGVTNYTVPDGINAIASYAFSGCNGLEYVEFPFIGVLHEAYGRPFGNAANDTFSIRIPSSLDYMNMDVNYNWWESFSSYYGKRIQIMQGDDEIWWHFPEGQEVEGEMPGVSPYLADAPLVLPLENTLVPLVSFPWETITGKVYCGFTGSGPTVSDNAFASITGVDYVSLPAGVTEIGDDAFAGCSELRVFPLPGNNALEVIGAKAFKGCKKINTIKLPAITTIGNRAFMDMTGLTTLRLGASLDSIGIGILAFSTRRDFIDSQNKLSIWFLGPYPSNVSDKAFVGYVPSGSGEFQMIDPGMVYILKQYKAEYARGFSSVWNTLTTDDVTFLNFIG